MARRLTGWLVSVVVGAAICTIHPVIIAWYLATWDDAAPWGWPFWLLDAGMGIALGAANGLVGFELGWRGRQFLPLAAWLCLPPPFLALFTEPIVGILALYIFLAGQAGFRIGSMARKSGLSGTHPVE